MSRIKYVIVFERDLCFAMKEAIKLKFVSSYFAEGRVIIAAKGVNKTTLRKLLQKEGK